MSDFPSSFKTLGEREAQIGDALRQLRHDAELDQSGLADRANVSQSAIQSLDAGKGSRLRTLLAVLRALDRLDIFDAIMPLDGPTPLQLLAQAQRGMPKRRRYRRSREGRDVS